MDWMDSGEPFGSSCPLSKLIEYVRQAFQSGPLEGERGLGHKSMLSLARILQFDLLYYCVMTFTHDTIVLHSTNKNASCLKP